MKNILSYKTGTQFSGAEILSWAEHQVRNKTSHLHQGAHILKRFHNVNPQRQYCIKSSYLGTGHGKNAVIHKPLVVKAFNYK